MHHYPSWIAGLSHEVNGFDRASYCAEHLRVGERLVLRREPNNPADPCAVAISPDDDPSVVLGYVPAEHTYVEKAMTDDHLIIWAVVKSIECTGLFRRKARRVAVTIFVPNAAENRQIKAEAISTP